MSLLIFDCDGVLIDSEILHSEVESEIGRDILGVDRDAMTHNRLFAGGGLKNVYGTWQRESGKPLPSDLDAEMARRKAEAFGTRLQAIPHIAESLAQLSGFPCCVASGSPLPIIEMSLRLTGLYDFFAPHLFSADSVSRGKPAPDIFLLAASRMGFDPQDCIVIEDSVHGVNAALAAQMPVIGFTGASHCTADHAQNLKGATRIIADMKELPPVVHSLFSERSALPRKSPMTTCPQQ